MCTPKNSFVLVHQNIREIISKTEELQEYFSNDKIYPHILCFSEYHMSRDDVHFVPIENYTLWSSFSRSTFQNGCVCVCVCVYIYIHTHNDVSFDYLDFSKYCKEKILELCAVEIVTTDK